MRIELIMKFIDLNADLGEGCADDSAIIPLLSSANISCGAHAGTEHDIRAALLTCQQYGVVVGAHPSYPDRANFGRTVLAMTHAELISSLTHQLNTFQGYADVVGVPVRYVKPHGALYNQAAIDSELAQLLVTVIKNHNPQLAVLTLPESQLHHAARAGGLAVYQEAFADRAYQVNGQLVSRSQPGAVLSHHAALKQSIALVTQGRITASDGSALQLNADSLCLHGDSPEALQLAIELRHALQSAGICIQAFVGRPA
jgi:UPF0271 protein